MAAQRYAGFVGPSYIAQSIVAADDQTINLIPSKIESGTGAGGVQYVFDPSPGFAAGFLTNTAPGCRASYELNELAFAVIGGQLAQILLATPTTISISFVATIGGQTSPPTPASITANGDAGHQVMVANGVGDLYWYDTISHANAKITTVSGHAVAFLNGYFIALNTTTSTIYVSALEDGTSWDAGDAAQRNDFPDKWQAMIVRLPDLLLFGTESISVYYNDSSSTFPFVPNPSVAITRGIKSAASLALLQGHPIWLADDLTVRYMPGYAPQRISTHALEYAIAQYADADKADGFVHNEQGHSFYTLNFATAGVSWRFDMTTGLWHQVGPYASGSDTFGVLQVGWAMRVKGVQIAFSRTTQSIYFMSQASANDIVVSDGSIGGGITRRRRAPQLVNLLHDIGYDLFQLFMEVGIAPASGPGSTPTVLLQWSNDGGQTFNAGLSRSTGLHNAFSTRVRWRNLGRGRQRVFQLTQSDPIACRWIDAFLDMREGAS